MNIRKVIKEEMDNSLEWIQNVNATPISMDEEWLLVNDIDPESIEEGIEIQKYLIDLGYSWGGPDNQELKNFCINAIYHFPNYSGGGKMLYHNGCREAEIRITNNDIENGSHDRLYYWSEIKPTYIKEEINDMKWIQDIMSNQEIAQEIADETKINSGGIYVPFDIDLIPPHFIPIFTTLSHPFSISMFPLFSKYCRDAYGITKREFRDVWERYMEIIINKINNLNESDDFDFIKDHDSLDGVKFIAKRYSPSYMARSYPITFTIEDNNVDSTVIITWESPEDDYARAEAIYERGAVKLAFRHGHWIVHDKTINESNDMDWIDDVPGIEIGFCYSYFIEEPLVIERIRTKKKLDGYPFSEYYDVQSIDELNPDEYKDTTVYSRNDETGYIGTIKLDMLIKNLTQGKFHSC